MEDLAALTKARSLLILLLATCKETLLALEAAANALDTDLTADLKAMIERSQAELVALDVQIKAVPASQDRLVAREPSDDELLEFVDLLLSNLDRELREPDVLAEAVRDRREMWVMLYRVSQGSEDGESRTQVSLIEAVMADAAEVRDRIEQIFATCPSLRALVTPDGEGGARQLAATPP